MKRRLHGFTLVEVLIVMVIAASVMAFGLPAYKRAQDKNSYQAALGVLQDIATSVKQFQQELRVVGKWFPIGFGANGESYALKISQETCSTQYTAETATNNAQMLCAFFQQGYIQPIAWDGGNSTGDSFKNYEFYVCSKGVPCSVGLGNLNKINPCCKGDTLAYMATKEGVTRASGDMYYGAVVRLNGEIIKS